MCLACSEPWILLGVGSCTPGTFRNAGTAASAFLPVSLSVVGEDRLMLCLKTHSYTFLSCHLAQAVLLHWEQGQNTALILHYATISLKMLTQWNMASPKVPLVSMQVLVCAEHKCHRLLHFFSWEQVGGIRSDQVPCDDVCHAICWHMVRADCSFSLPHFIKWSWKYFIALYFLLHISVAVLPNGRFGLLKCEIWCSYLSNVLLINVFKSFCIWMGEVRYN